MKMIAVLFLVLLSVSSTVTAQTPCDLEGAWQLVSAKYNNEPAPATFTGIKMFSKTHFAVVGEDTAFRRPTFTPAEALNFYSNIVAVAGTYTVSGNTWTEKLEHSTVPSLVGLSIPFQCQREGDRLIQKGSIPIMSGGKKTGDLALEEVWRRADRP
jgi:lipocalin-like protein